MALIQYDPLVAYDAMSGELLVTATGTIHALDDVDALTPLPVTDLAGVPLAGAQVPVVRGLTTGFRVEDAQRVMWVSGEHRITLWSPTGLQAAAEAAATSAASSLVSVTGQVDRAEQAALRAEAAAGQASAVTDAAVAEVLSVPTSATVAALYALGLGLSASETAPTDPGEGDVWWDSTTGGLWRYDATYLTAWVPVGEPPPMTAYQGLALGRATVEGTQSVAIGAEARVADGGSHAVAIGYQAAGTEQYGVVAIGAAAAAAGSRATALGTDTVASEDYAVALGGAAAAQDSGAIAIGGTSSATGGYAVALGYAAVASAREATALGRGSSAQGEYAIALGAFPLAQGDDAIAVGQAAQARSTEAIAIGHAAGVTDAPGGIKIGSGQVSTENGTGVGTGSNVSTGGSVALGHNTGAHAARAVAIGEGAISSIPDRTAIATAELELTPHLGAETQASTLILRSPDGTAWRIAVDDAGALSTTEIL